MCSIFKRTAFWKGINVAHVWQALMEAYLPKAESENGAAQHRWIGLDVLILSAIECTICPSLCRVISSSLPNTTWRWLDLLKWFPLWMCCSFPLSLEMFLCLLSLRKKQKIKSSNIKLKTFFSFSKLRIFSLCSWILSHMFSPDTILKGKALSMP